MINVLSKIKRLEGTNKQILLNTAGAFTVRGAGLVVSFFTMPAYMRYFEDQKILGLWFTMLSVFSWILTFDLGIGNGLRNKLVKPLIEHDILSAKSYISSAYMMSSIVVVIALVLGRITFPLINWNSVFNISVDVVSAKILLEIIQLVFAGIMLQFLLSLVFSILYALQKSAFPNLLYLISNIALLIFVLSANSGSIESNLKMLAGVNILFTNLPLIAATVIVFMTGLKFCAPSIHHFKIKFAKDVMKLGGIFFGLQIMSLLITSTNEFLITWLTGTKNVVDYQIYNKLFLLVGTIFTLALTPIWSAVTKALSQNDFIWIGKLYKILKCAAAVFIVGEFVLILMLQLLVNIWLGNNAIKINIIYSLIFAVSGSLYIWHSAITSIVNGIGKLRIQFIWLTFGAVIKIPVAYILFKMTGSWISVVVANFIALLPYCIVQPFFINKYLKNS